MSLSDGVFMLILGFLLLAYCGGSEQNRKEEERKKNTISVQLDVGQSEIIPEGKFIELKPGQLYDPDRRRVVRVK
jgi:hypothetical protein